MAFSRLERERENERGIGVGRQGGTPCIYKPKLVRAKKRVSPSRVDAWLKILLHSKLRG